ncbi:1 3-beta-glucanosyltransferase gel4 [Coemansia erecta]|uniref:1,3-beta-glucanosyltransferase n=1 Tax=Coemansia asiatica TaxID=1052880 RepID=A0A9W7XQW6_9FUNG|nr:1 3-beta-glucanosyltransferase gel4 [Coemansia asiatica]KAJ2845490.1 1 3-beta-glucanosyltransferase gel4 [Coemansia erecta]KAJ2882354.1 1 3-beta-glucanosyltransferase gel4 [Coemansia asiatica]
MKLPLFASAGIGALCAASAVLAIDPIVIKGSKFFNEKTGEQFFFKGIAYQPRTGLTSENPDPLADTVGCKRDVELFKDLGINSIRVYEVDYNKNHDTCMKLLEDAGIYLVLDMPSPKYSINRAQPYWDHDTMSHWAAKVDAFAKYPNLVAWIAGNEVANDKNTTPSAAFVKAAIRDMKAYLKSKGLSTPVGYADNDDMEIRMNLINYFSCGDKETRADFYGINTYRWCGDDATFQSSGYSDITKNMTDYTIPSLMTEFGCNLVRPRAFHEVDSILGSDMSDIFSGGIMYEFTEEDNNYGVVKVSYGSSEVEKTEDYENLKKAYTKASPKGAKMNDYKPSGKDSVCPQVSSVWQVKGDTLPPTPSSARCKCMMDSLGCTITKSELSADEGKAVGEVVGNICGLTDCKDISYDTSKGVYGNYAACDSVQRSAWALNKNFVNSRYTQCEVKGVDTAIVKSPKQEDTDVCLTMKDDMGNIAAPITPSEDDEEGAINDDGEDTGKGSGSKSGSNNDDEDSPSRKTSSETSAGSRSFDGRSIVQLVAGAATLALAAF